MASKLNSVLGDYLREIKHYALLTAEEERELGTIIQAAAAGEQKFSAGEIGPSEYEQMQRAAAEARNKMIQANLRLVISVAKGFSHRGLPMEDLVNEGNVGLMSAVDRFDPTVGSRFSTYASYWIDQAIRRAVQNSSQMIHIPSYLMEQIGHMKLAMRELEARLSRPATLQELSDHMEISPRKAAAISQAIKACTCPTQESSSDDGVSLTASLPDTRTPSPADQVFSDSDADFVGAILNKITDREAKVLKMRYGLTNKNGKRMTLKEIGDAVGLTRERVRQIEKEARIKLEEQAKGER
ncbi:MAG: RNA polymerase sigma factor RpoD/SigA [Phycisphaerae bacterium]